MDTKIIPTFRRSFNFIQIKSVNTDIILVKKDDSSRIYILKGISKDLWIRNQFIYPSEKEMADALILKKLGIIQKY